MSGDPFTDMMEQFRDEILSGIKELLQDEASRETAGDAVDLDPFSLYDASEAAEILNVDRSTMYRIPETELPRCRVGPSRGNTRWMGADLLAYARGLDPLDYQSLIEDLRNEMRRPHPDSASEPSDGPTRVL